MAYTIAINHIATCDYTVLGYTDNPDDIALVIKNVILNLRDGDVIEITRDGEDE